MILILRHFFLKQPSSLEIHLEIFSIEMICYLGTASESSRVGTARGSKLSGRYRGDHCPIFLTRVYLILCIKNFLSSVTSNNMCCSKMSIPCVNY